MSDPEYDPRKLPNFDALREWLAGDAPKQSAHLRVVPPLTDEQLANGVLGWIGKLEAWAATAVAEIDRLDRAENQFEIRLERTEAAADELEALQERILDMERGILSPDELVGALR